jgi:hypothetical protein
MFREGFTARSGSYLLFGTASALIAFVATWFGGGRAPCGAHAKPPAPCVPAGARRARASTPKGEGQHREIYSSGDDSKGCWTPCNVIRA